MSWGSRDGQWIITCGCTVLTRLVRNPLVLGDGVRRPGGWVWCGCHSDDGATLIGNVRTVPRVPTLGDVLASNVRAERARRRWRQADLAERLGWPQSSVSDLESGRRKIGVDDIVPLCRAFDVTLARLLDGAEPGELHLIGVA